MDTRLLATTFLTIFLAELGDKTQLAVFSLSSSTKKPWAVFWGASAALLASTATAVLLGGWLAKHFPELLVRRAAASLFILIGLWMWIKK